MESKESKDSLNFQFDNILPVKKCVKCKEFRILSDYCNNKYGIDGLSWICNDCKKKIML